MHDVIIIGAGISGMYLGNHFHNNNKKFIIIERKKRIGGRIKTFNNQNIIYEIGAYRFSENHKKLIKLINKYNLQKYVKKMNNKKDFFSRDGNSTKVYNTKYKLNYKNIIQKLSEKTEKELINNDILTLTTREYDIETSNYIKDYCGYDNFITNSSGINLINYHKNINSEFYNLSCGFTEIINILFKNIEKNVILGEELLNIQKKNDHFSVITSNKVYHTQKIIITIPKENLIKIPFIYSNVKYLESVSSSPYIRIFAQYPKINGKNWFDDINYTITDKVIRKIIPEDYEKGLIQVCYSDDKNANYLRNIISNGEIKKYINDNFKKIFPHKKIPEPIFFNCHYWKYGNHFWLPLYNNKKIEKYMLNPHNNIYIAGESYSNNQAWIEGSLETCDQIIDLIDNKFKKTKKKQTKKTYALQEVQKHNHEKSAWTIVNNKVYNITNMIKDFKHPGGNIINIAMGRDITELFYNIGHSEFSKNLLENFYIGELKIK